MLVLSRKLDESIVIDGRITVKVLRVEGDVVKLGILAPAQVPVHRKEIYDEICKSNREAAQGAKSVPKLSLARAIASTPAPGVFPAGSANSH